VPSNSGRILSIMVMARQFVRIAAAESTHDLHLLARAVAVIGGSSREAAPLKEKELRSGPKLGRMPGSCKRSIADDVRLRGAFQSASFTLSSTWSFVRATLLSAASSSTRAGLFSGSAADVSTKSNSASRNGRIVCPPGLMTTEGQFRPGLVTG
jgi:hypothetical protein